MSSSNAAVHLPHRIGHAECDCDQYSERKNLVVCIDGTSNSFNADLELSNVIRLYDQMEKDETQLTYYNSGVGTYARTTWYSLWQRGVRYIRSKFSQLIAWDIHATVLDAYRWLSDNYEAGDRIFLFGFSRGAYQVRILSGMIQRLGLIHKGNTEQIPYVWELYEKLEDAGTPLKPNDDFQEGTAESAFKHAFCRDVRVHFVGVWDTVSSVGWWRGKIYANVITGMMHVCYFRHALALDERRVKFLPEYVRGGSSLDSKKANYPYYLPPHVKEVWFAGTHWDVGGGSFTFREIPPSLAWMMMEAGETGLRLTPFQSSVMPKPVLGEDSLTAAWKIFEYFPLTRSYYGSDGGDPAPGDRTTRKPNCSAGRIIQKGQKIHQSVLHILKDSPSDAPRYQPKAKFHKALHTSWKAFDESNLSESLASMIEPWGALADVMEYKLATADNRIERLEKLHDLSRSDFGKQVLIQAGALHVLLPSPSPETTGLRLDYDSFEKIREILEQVYDQRRFKKLPFVDVQPLLRDLFEKGPSDGSHAQAARSFIETYTDYMPVDMGSIHEDGLPSNPVSFFSRNAPASATMLTSFWPPGTAKYVLTASYDGRIRIWDVRSRRKVVAMTQPEKILKSFACSTDGQYGVSRSLKTVYVWSLQKGTQITQFSFPQESIHAAIFSAQLSGDLIISSKTTTGLSRIRQIQFGDWSLGNGLLVLSAPVVGDMSTPGKTDISHLNPALWELWGLESGEPDLSPFDDSNHISGATDVTISRDRTIAALMHDSHIKIYQRRAGKDDSTSVDHNQEEQDKAHANNGSENGDAEDRNIFKFHSQMSLLDKELKRPFVFSADGRHLLASSRAGHIHIYDTQTLSMKALLSLETENKSESLGKITSIDVSEDNKYIVCASNNGYVRVWYAESLLNGPNFY